MSGMPLETSGDATTDWCTASCPFNDRQRLALARLEVGPSTPESHVGSGIIVVMVFDLLRNESVRRLRHCLVDGAMTSEHVSHVTVSTNDRYVVAALQRASDDLAMFVVFDLLMTSSNNSTRTLTLDANAEVFLSSLTAATERPTSS